MTESHAGAEEEGQQAMTVLIVVGAHLRAEIGDRPLAYKVREQINDWAEEHESALRDPIIGIVCCDVWYLNNTELHRHPVISVGGPGVNALSAYFSDKLTSALVRDEKLIIQLDPEFVDLRSCIWGMDHDFTVEAVELFLRRYLAGYMEAVATQVEPGSGGE